MRNFLVAIAVVSMGFFSSCDKCKDKTCENAASCDKKTADCSNVCVNGGTSDASTGSCACTEFYNGGTCRNEVRNDLKGDYTGTLSIPGVGNFGTSIAASNFGTDATAQSFKIAITLAPGSITNIDVNGVLTAKDSVIMPRTLVPLTIMPGETEGYVSGTGYYLNNKLIASMTIQGKLSGFSLGATYSGEK